jgi:FAD-dependent urate hydroxylase
VCGELGWARRLEGANAGAQEGILKARLIVKSTIWPVAIIGAGPYGLSAAAYLRAANVEVHIFGEPMGYWLRHMPTGMLLRSSWEASRIADPARTWTLDEYQARCGTHVSTPIPLQDFIAYGQWFQRQVAPDVDQRRVTRIQSTSHGFHLVLQDGASLRAQRVIVATPRSAVWITSCWRQAIVWMSDGMASSLQN